MQINHKHFELLDSTNDYLLAFSKTTAYDPNTITICTAAEQTKARGQHGKPWYSPANCNLYFSYLYSSNKSVNNLGYLTIAVANVVVQTLQAFNISDNIRIKKPNDIMWHNRKLAGILVETNHNQHHNITNVVIGIGLNVNLDKASDTQIDQPWVSMQQVLGAKQDIADITQILTSGLSNLEK